MGLNEIHNVIKDILCGKQVKVNIGEKLVILSFCNKNLKYLIDKTNPYIYTNVTKFQILPSDNVI